MTVNLLQALNAYKAIISLMTEKLPFKTAHALLMAKKELQIHYDFYVEQENSLVQEYALRNKDRTICVENNQVQIPSDKLAEFRSHRAELDSIEVSVDLKEPTLYGVTEISPAILEPLLDIFKFEE